MVLWFHHPSHYVMLCQAEPEFTQQVLLSNVRASDAVMADVSESEIRFSIQRHAVGDWGAVNAQISEVNRLAMIDGRPVMSVFLSKKGRKFWVITSADRSVTQVRFANDNV